jgi:predicted RNase H-like HicB family nuclease
MREFGEELQRTLSEGKPVEETLTNAQEAWEAEF